MTEKFCNQNTFAKKGERHNFLITSRTENHCLLIDSERKSSFRVLRFQAFRNERNELREAYDGSSTRTHKSLVNKKRKEIAAINLLDEFEVQKKFER